MADETREQNHTLMQEGAMRPVSGPAASDALAASGGLELPGQQVRPHGIGTGAATHEPIPGERDPGTLTHREAGALGTHNGEQLPPAAGASLDADAAEEARREGGGAPRERTHSD
jgi:hypothetical protein